MILNADDFGGDVEANRAIMMAFERGLATSTSVLPNGDAFDEACELARERGFGERVGVHLVLTQGEPLTEAIRANRRFCDADGRFFEWRGSAHAFRLGEGERDGLARELRAQVERCRAAGLSPAHLDSHHHVHNEWAIGTVVSRLARELGIRRVRLARNCGAGIGVASSLYKRVFNGRLQRAGLAATRYFGDANDWLQLRDSGADAVRLDDFELMMHPRLADCDVLVDPQCGGRPLEKLLEPVLVR